jgi:hypothetical protein
VKQISRRGRRNLGERRAPIKLFVVHSGAMDANKNAAACLSSDFAPSQRIVAWRRTQAAHGLCVSLCGQCPRWELRNLAQKRIGACAWVFVAIALLLNVVLSVRHRLGETWLLSVSISISIIATCLMAVTTERALSRAFLIGTMNAMGRGASP